MSTQNIVRIVCLLTVPCAAYAASAATTVKTVALTAYDVVYDPFGQRLYAAVGQSDAQYPNCVVRINPRNATVENAVWAGSDPRKLAISDDGQYIYIGLNGAGRVSRYNVAAEVIDQDFSLGSGSFGTTYAEDIAVQPGRPSVIAVSRFRKGVSPRHDGVAIYENGVMRPEKTRAHTGANRIEFSDDPQILYGYNNETTGFGVYTLVVNDDGVGISGTYTGLISGFGVDIAYDANRLYATSGRVIDTDTMQFIGQFPSGGKVAPDSKVGRTFFITNSTVTAYYQDTFTLAGQVTLSGVSGSPANLIRWGADGLAFSTSGHQVVIVQTDLVPLAALAILAVDPAEDFVVSGDAGGPFEPGSQVYSLTNTGDDTLFWGAAADADWVSVTPEGGFLPPGGSLNLTVSLTEAAALLPSGEYVATVGLTDVTHGQEGAINVVLSVHTTPPVLEVTPSEDFAASGDHGGPFEPPSKVYVLTNPGDDTLFWGVVADADWVSVEPQWGPILPGGSANLTVSLTEAAALLPYGEHVAIVSLTDITHGQEAAVRVVLSVVFPQGALDVTPAEDFVASAIHGGPFEPTSKVYVLSNTGGSPLTWSLEGLPSWLSADVTSGGLDPQQSVEVTLSLTEEAETMAVGSYSQMVVFRNVTTQEEAPREVRLDIQAPFEELARGYRNSNFNLTYSSLLFRPDGSSGYYTACRQVDVQQFPVDPAGGTPLVLWDDDAAEVVLSDGATIDFFGREYDRVYIGSNGYLTFGQGDTAATASWDNHFALPRISAFFADLTTVGPDHVSYRQLADRLAVTYSDMRLAANRDKHNNFQVALSLRDGSIEITWLRCDANDEIVVGLSRGYGEQTRFTPTDLSALTACCECGDLTGDGFVGLADLEVLVDWWLTGDCGVPGWCGRADLDRDGQVTMADLAIMAGDWWQGEIGWGQPVLLSELNEGDNFARAPALTADERLIVFMRFDPVSGYNRLFEATRETPDEPFTNERKIDELVATGYNIGFPWVSPDGLSLYYWEKNAPPGVQGPEEIKLARRDDPSRPWQYVRTLTELSPNGEECNGPALTEDELTIVFFSYRSGSAYDLSNLWMATRDSVDEPFASIRPLDEINSNRYEKGRYLSPDGLKLLFSSNRRYASLYDMYQASRSSLVEPFGNVEILSVNSESSGDTDAFLSYDGKRLYFTRGQGAGPYGVYMAQFEPVTRECVPR